MDNEKKQKTRYLNSIVGMLNHFELYCGVEFKDFNLWSDSCDPIKRIFIDLELLP